MLFNWQKFTSFNWQIYRYARVSSITQDIELQKEALEKGGSAANREVRRSRADLFYQWFRKQVNYQ